MSRAREALRAALCEMEGLVCDQGQGQGQGQGPPRYDVFMPLLEEYRRVLCVHAQMQSGELPPLLEASGGPRPGPGASAPAPVPVPVSPAELSERDDALWAEVEASLAACRDAIDNSKKEEIRSKAHLLYQDMLSNMATNAERIDYTSLVEVVKESKRYVWLQDALGYLCALQGLRDTGADTVYRSLFKELRSLLLFLKTVSATSLLSTTDAVSLEVHIFILFIYIYITNKLIN
jgi:hypothetical protein